MVQNSTLQYQTSRKIIQNGMNLDIIIGDSVCRAI